MDKQQGKEMYSFLQVSSRKDLQQQKMDCSWGPKKKTKNKKKNHRYGFTYPFKEKARRGTRGTEDETRMSSLDAWKIKGCFVKIEATLQSENKGVSICSQWQGPWLALRPSPATYLSPGSGCPRSGPPFGHHPLPGWCGH